MKTLAFAVIVITVLTSNTQTNAQPAGPMGPGQPPKSMPKGPEARGLEPVTSFKGKIVKTISNDDFVYDGFYLLSNQDSLLVKFPPHLGKQIDALGKVGTNVTVTGTSENSPSAVREIRLVSLTANGKKVTDTAPPVPPVPTEEKFVDGTGRISSMQTDREGRVNGFVLDNKTLLRIPPQVSSQLASSVSKGVSIGYSGNQKTSKSGEMSTADYAVIRCKTLTVNGQQYLVK